MIGFLRKVSPQLEKCELTHVPRAPINATKAAAQLEKYAEALVQLGVQIIFARELPEHPDGVFIEDTAILLPEVAVIARPGATSRLAEIDSIVSAVAEHRPVQSVAEPGTVDGGDVLRIGRTLFVAESQRTNAEGIAQLREIVLPFGYEVRNVAIRGCLHLKSACSFIPPHFLVANPQWIDPAALGNFVVIAVDEKEPFAANTLTVGRTTLVSASHPRTEKQLREAGIATRRVEISEFEKAEGGLTCLSLLLEPRASSSAGNEPALKTVQATGIPPPRGHATHAIVHDGLVYVSPQTARIEKTPKNKRLPVEEQAEGAIRNLSLVLNAAGSSLNHVVRTTIHLADPKHLERIDAVYARMFGAHRPVRTVVANEALGAGVILAIEAVAVAREGSTQ